MRRLGRAVAAFLAIPLVGGAGVGAAHAAAASGSVLYVGNVAGCSDAGGGSSAAAPFCTVQAAADAAVAGDTVDIAAGYYGSVVVKSVGTAAAPIVFVPVGGVVSLDGGTGVALTFDGASHVTFEGSGSPGGSPGIRVGQTVVDDSSSIELDSMNFAVLDSGVVGPVVQVTGGSSEVTVSRSLVTGGIEQNGGIQIDSGGSGDVLSTNIIYDVMFGISVSGATGTEITGNTIYGTENSFNQVELTDGSSGASVQNNIFAYAGGSEPSATTATLAVDATSTPGTTVDYNVVDPSEYDNLPLTWQNAYTWGTAHYAGATAFYQGTGQGEHDLTADPQLTFDVDDASASPFAPQNNSADSAAPGALTTDIYGNSCDADPAFAITGAGSPAFCARGAIQPQYSTQVAATVSASGAMSAAASASIIQKVTAGSDTETVSPIVTPAVSYVVNWGDGTTSGPIQSASQTPATDLPTHAYSARGTYTVSVTADLTDGSQVSTSSTVTTAGAGFVPITPRRILDTRSGVGDVKGALGAGCYGIPAVSGVPATATALVANLTVTDTTGGAWVSVAPDSAVSNVNYGAGQTKANGVVIPLQSDGWFDVCSGGTKNASADVIIDATGYFTETGGIGFAPVTPARVLDTRSGNGAAKAKVGAHSGIPVKIAGLDSIPSGVSAVAVHVTEVDATANGWIAAEPDGAGVPKTSSLNSLQGQTVSNTVIVPVAADGKIELYNGASTGSVDLIADVSGYFSATAPDMFVALAPYRAWDTRAQGRALKAGATETYPLGTATTPQDATLMANLTVVDTTGNGVVTAYPSGTARPVVSNVNYLENQTVGVLAVLPTAGTGDEADAYDQGSGSTDLILDVFGYFSAN